MRVEYGSAEKDGSPDLDADWLGRRLACTAAQVVSRCRTARAWRSRTRWWWGRSMQRGRPVTRSVLCKSMDETGITFFTNYDSAKGDELAANPYASATFPWFLLGRQVHVRGPVTKVSAEQTADYWSKRPRGSQLGAWASHQSRPIASRAALLEQLAEVTERFADRRRGPGAAELGWLPDRARGRRVLAGPGKPGTQQDSRRAGPRRAPAALSVRRLFADTTPLRTPDFRRLWLCRDRHGHRREPDHLRGAGAALRAHPKLGVRRAFRVSSRWCHSSCSGCGAAPGRTRWTGACC